MIGAVNLFPDYQRAPVEWLSLAVIFLRVLEHGEVVQARRHAGMSGSDGLLLDRKRAVVENLGLRVGTLGSADCAEVGQAQRHVGLVGA